MQKRDILRIERGTKTRRNDLRRAFNLRAGATKRKRGVARKPAEITQELYKDTIFNFDSWQEVEQERISKALVKKLGSGAALTDKLGVGSSGTAYSMKNGNVVKIVLESYLPPNFNTFYFQLNEDDVGLAIEIGKKKLGPEIFEHGALYLQYEKGEKKKLDKKSNEYFAKTGDNYDDRDPILHKQGIKFYYMVMQRLYDTDSALNNRDYKEKREEITREILKIEPLASDFEFGFIKPLHNISDLRAYDLLIGDPSDDDMAVKSAMSNNKRPPPEETLESSHKKTKVLNVNQFDVGIEIETCCPDPPRLTYFEEEGDGSIRCNDGGDKAVEFILAWNCSRYFMLRESIKNDMQKIFDACSTCGTNKSGQSTCGIHVHLSHPDLKKKEYPSFGRFFSNYWINSLYNKLKTDFGLRTNNQYCVENKCYYRDKNDKYRQLNILPSLDEDSEVWHFEFRGMGDIKTVNVELIDKFIEALASGFTEGLRLLQGNVKFDNVDFEEELFHVILAEEGSSMSNVIEVIRDAKKAGKAIDLDGKYDDDDEETWLNMILYHLEYDMNDRDLVEEVLEQSNNLDPYYDDNWYSPLFWIAWTNEKLAISLIPYFKARGYKLGKDKKEFDGYKEFLKAWNSYSGS